MALSKCGFCGNGSFELKEVAPHGSAYKLYFVQCASCGAPVATQDFFNTGAQLEALSKKVAKLDDELQGLRRDIRIVAAAMDQSR